MTIADLIKVSEKIKLYSAIINNYASNDESVEKPKIVVKNVANFEVELLQGPATDAVILAIDKELRELKEKYQYIVEKIDSDFKMSIEELTEKYATEDYLSTFKDALNASREKNNGASLTFTVIEDENKDDKPQVSMCTIKLKDIFEKNTAYLSVEDMISGYSKKIATPNYIRAINWLKNIDIDKFEVPQQKIDHDSERDHAIYMDNSY